MLRSMAGRETCVQIVPTGSDSAALEMENDVALQLRRGTAPSDGDGGLQSPV